MPGILPTAGSGLRVLSCSEWVAPPPEGRGLALTQGRLKRGKQGRIGAGRVLGWTRLIHIPAFIKKLVTPPSSYFSLWQSLLWVLYCVKPFPQTTEIYLPKVPRASAAL